MSIQQEIIAEQTPATSRRATTGGTSSRQGRQQTQRNRNLLYALSIPALLLDNDGYVTDANPALLRLLNKTTQQVVSQNISELLTIDSSVLQSSGIGEPQTSDLLLAGEDHDRYLEVTISSLQFSDQMTGYMVMLNDVTERKREDIARATMIDSLESYASAIAHDLKSPLATVMGFASLLEMSGTDLSDDHRHYARTIQKISSKMATMIDKLLLFATLDKLEQIPLIRMDMSRLAVDVVEMLSDLVKQYHANVTIAPNMPQAVGYVPWIEVVLANLISNAMKYGGKEPKVVVTATQVDSKVYYWVHDNGAGMTQEQIDQLFKRSVRFDPHPKGHGQGLMIARRIIDRLGGEIGVASQPGHGTTFYFSLPVATTATEVVREVQTDPAKVA